MYYASFYPYGCNIANVFDILAFESKQERDKWLENEHNPQHQMVVGCNEMNRERTNLHPE